MTAAATTTLAPAASVVTQLELTHIATGKLCKTAMLVENYEQQVKPSWATQEVYGRMDPIMTYQNTQRTFTIVLRTPGVGEGIAPEAVKRITAWSSNVGESGFNKTKLNSAGLTGYLKDIRLMYKMMYPYYEGHRDQAFLKSPPLLKLTAGGLTGGGGGVHEANTLVFAPTAFTVNSIASSKGPAVAINTSADLRFAGNSEGYKVTLQGTVLHTDRVVGWVPVGDAGISFAVKQFPYAVDKGTSAIESKPSMKKKPTPRNETGADRSERLKTEGLFLDIEQ